MNDNQRLFVAGTSILLIGVLFSVLTITVSVGFVTLACGLSGLGLSFLLAIPYNLLGENDSEP